MKSIEEIKKIGADDALQMVGPNYLDDLEEGEEAKLTKEQGEESWDGLLINAISREAAYKLFGISYPDEDDDSEEAKKLREEFSKACEFYCEGAQDQEDKMIREHNAKIK